MELFAIMCAFLGIKLVDIEAVFCDRDMAQAMATMLRTSVNSPDLSTLFLVGRQEVNGYRNYSPFAKDS